VPRKAPLPAFAGWDVPHTTQVPDMLFDELLPDLSGAELKVLLYIIRRTFGFKKDADAIALSQIQHGITRADGTRLDRGTGLAKSTAVEAIKRLEAMGIIEAVRSGPDGARGWESTTYRPRMAGAPLSDNRTSHVQKSDPALVRESAIQETAVTTYRENGSDENRRAALKADLRARLKRWHLAATPRHEKSLLGLWLAADDPHAFAARLEYAAIGAQDAAEVLGRLTSVPRRY
jgi:DNA-binding transcriptional ArsR family regulator